jgi:hypothetical protein
MLFLGEPAARNRIGLLFLLKLLLLSLLLMLSPLSLVLRVVCHDALFVNTTCATYRGMRSPLRPASKKPIGTTYNRSVRCQARWYRARRELSVDGAGHDRARKRQANEKTAEDGSGDEEIQDPHDDTLRSARALSDWTTRSLRLRFLASSGLWICCAAFCRREPSRSAPSAIIAVGTKCPTAICPRR